MSPPIGERGRRPCTPVDLLTSGPVGKEAIERIRGPEDLRARGPERAGTWFLRPRAERLTPERLTTVAVTRHLRMNSFRRMRCHRIPTQDRPLMLKKRHLGERRNTESYNLATLPLNRGYLGKFI